MIMNIMIQKISCITTTNMYFRKYSMNLFFPAFTFITFMNQNYLYERFGLISFDHQDFIFSIPFWISSVEPQKENRILCFPFSLAGSSKSVPGVIAIPHSSSSW
mmetsp:Transcript_19294/g.24881  ORF Transcript_19294/g.24881 Transcript_19294/m.24881 type:complete len:104 (-) Transcript_19294:1220-1531(-)